MGASDIDITTLPVYPHLDAIAEQFFTERELLITAGAGAGKTTLVPLHLLRHPKSGKGKIALLQPRRIAARAAADRIASLLGEQRGDTVGLHTKFEKATGPRTTLEVMTEGILVRMLQDDPALSSFDTVIFDECHERNIQGDLALAMVLDVKRGIRPDLGILFMSATPSMEDLSIIFPGLRRIDIPGKTFPVSLSYHPPETGEKIWDGAVRLVSHALKNNAAPGDILVFLPGFREIVKAREKIEAAAEKMGGNINVEILHGSLSPEDQQRVLQPDAKARRVILSTNIAETSLTIPGVGTVIDCGFERRVRFSPRTGMGHWETVRISAASAEQRKGRAGRTGPGTCFRWWRNDEALEETAPPEIMTADLAPLALEIAVWGTPDLASLTFLSPPPPTHYRRARELLARLGLIDADGVITERGRRAASLGIHPRLGRMVVEAEEKGQGKTAALIPAILEEGDASPTSDFRDRIESWMGGKPGNRRVTEEASRIARKAGCGASINASDAVPELAGPLLLLAFPDRSAVRAESHGQMSRWILAGGRRALCRERFSGYDFLVVTDIDGGVSDGRIMLAAPLQKDDILEASGTAAENVRIDWKGWKPEIYVEIWAGALLLETKRHSAIRQEHLKAETMQRLHQLGIESLPWDEASRRFIARARFILRNNPECGFPDMSDQSLQQSADTWLLPFAALNGGELWNESSLLKGLEYRLGYANLQKLNDLAPEYVLLPSGKKQKIDYEQGEVPVIAARLQEFFGCAGTPEVGGHPALLHLLSPAGRPVQITRDLRGFWKGSYHEVRKELQGRYPRHYWPLDPMAAEPTSRAKPRKN